MVRVGKASTVGGRVVHGSGGECCGSAQVDVGSTPGRRVLIHFSRGGISQPVIESQQLVGS